MVFGSSYCRIIICFRSISPVDNSILVLVYELDITRAEFELAGLEESLACGIGDILKRFKVPVSLESPDFTIFLAGIITIDHVVAIPLENLCLIVGKVGDGIESEGSEVMVPVDVEFPAAGTERTSICVSCGSAKYARESLSRSEHVFCIALEPVSGNVEVALEETEIETDVGCCDCLPCQGLGNHLRKAEVIILAVAGSKPIDSIGLLGHCLEEHVGTNFLVTYFAVRSTELCIIDNRLQRLEERFVRDSPTDRSGKEGSPLVFYRELGRSVATNIEFCKVLACVVIIDTSKEAERTLLGGCGCSCSLRW